MIPRAVVLAALALAAALATLVAPAPATAAVGPPYKLVSGGPGKLAATPANGGSTLAVQVAPEPGDPTKVRFTPAAADAGPCVSSAGWTTCPATQLDQELSLQGAIVQIAVKDVATQKLVAHGGPESDAIVVDGPDPASIDLLSLDPGAGDDTVTVSDNVKQIELVAPDAGNDRYDIRSNLPTITNTLDLGAGNDVASSAAPNLTMQGGAGDDTLMGAGTLVGGAGSDVVKPSGALDKASDGGAGAGDVDRLSFDLASAPLTLTSSAAGVQLGAFMHTGFEQLEGGRGNDTILGFTGAEVLFGGDGDDKIQGRGGSDVLDGGPGSNTISYENETSAITLDLSAGTAVWAAGSDLLSRFSTVLTGAGNDAVTGTPANESFALGAGADSVDAGDGNDSIDGQDGNDLLRGGRGTDSIAGGAGTDTTTYDERGPSEPVTVNLGVPAGNGAAGENDTLTGVESVTGGASNDTLTGDAGANVLIGGPGLNTLAGLAGNDIVYGGDNRDVISGGPGFDQLFGGDDDDSIDAFDGGIDIVDCGASPDDDAQVDTVDQVAGCEYSRRGDVPIPVDADGDGFVEGFDCDDADPTRRPGATDVPNDGIDQDCDGFDQPIPYIEYTLGAKFTAARRSGRKIRRLTIGGLESGARVQVTCKTTKRYPRRCPFTRRTKRPSRAGNVALLSFFRNRRLPPGTRIELRITAPDFNGRVRRFTIRSAGSVRDQRLCLPLGKSAPRRCPAGDE